MNTYIKSALSQIKAEDELIEKTEKKLRDILEKQKNDKTINLQKRSMFLMKKFVFAACVIILLCSMSIGGYAYYKTPVAYVSLDINPSVELGINAFNKVVSATGYNADGKTILKGQNVVNSNLKDAIKVLVKSASKNGFINKDGSTIISITSETGNADTASALEKYAEQGANDAIKSSNNIAVIYKDNVALARRDEARKLGITPGKLNLIQKLQTLDPTVTVDQYKDAKVTDIMKKIVTLSSTSSVDYSNKDIQDIESAVQQSEKNADNNNNHIDENNSQINNQENNSDNGTVTTSSVASNSNEVNSNNDNHKDGNHKGSSATTDSSETKSVDKSRDSGSTQNDKGKHENGNNNTEANPSTSVSTNNNNENNNNGNE